MRKGFTILELLVASLLLGMLVTILTMIFNQSSIAWRVGYATTSSLEKTRNDLAQVREEADNAIVADVNGSPVTRYALSIWDRDGKERQGSAVGTTSVADSPLVKDIQNKDLTQVCKVFGAIALGNASSGGSMGNYTVNVKSAGPDKQFNTWDDIWSYPDDFD